MSGYSGFQYNGFQNNGYQIVKNQNRPSGGYIGKIDSEAYAYAYNHADRLRNRVHQLPEPVAKVIEELVEIQEPLVRKELLREKIKVETKWLRLYEAIMEEYYSALLEYELMVLIQKAEDLQEEEDIMLLLLMT